MKALLSIGLLVLLPLASTASVGAASPDAEESMARRVLESFCIDCHGPEKQKARLRLDTLPRDFDDARHLETWHDVLTKLNVGEMPPTKAKQPSARELAQLVDWLTGEIEAVRRRQRQTGGRAVLRRMTRYEYANTLRDLLDLDASFGRNLPPEPISPDGFKNNGAFLGMSPIQLEYYLETARHALSRTIVVGPPPEHFEHVSKKTEKTRRKKEPTKESLEPGDHFLLRVNEFPRVGDIRVTVRAKAKLPEGSALPRLRVTLGVRSDVKTFTKTLGEVDVRETQDRETTSSYVFTGRVEDFPLPGHNPKFPGLLVNVWHVDTDGIAEPKQRKKSKRKKNKRQTEDTEETEPQLPPTAHISIEEVRFEGPVLGDWPPARHRRVLFDSPHRADERRYARDVLERFTRRAFRRRPETAEIEAITAFFDKVRPRFESFEETIRETLVLVLVSPDFLYLIEPRADGKPRQQLSEAELATRLSYFLWSTTPDDELLDLAELGALREGDALAKKARSMLSSPRSRAFVENFVSQWLDLDGLDRIAVNPEFYPDFDERLKSDMRAETLGFFEEVLRENHSALLLLDSNFTVVNRRLARHYGIPPPRGNRFERVPLDAKARRGGLLTHGSVLLINSNGEDSHPIKRAVWLLDRLLDDPPAPPPPDVPDLPRDEPDLARLPLKEQLELHREKPACNACHRRIDPWGLPFENYDAVGRWRTKVVRTVKRRRETATPVVASSTLPDGAEIDGMEALKRHLVEHRSRDFARSMVRKTLAYALARTLEIGDDEVVESLTDRFEASGYKIGELIVAIVESEPFRTK